ncbi:MAG: hypothetical protein M3P83_05105 [Actinomycetota bacterium]|nr:hypothetical protein [Actinomycetota bacterium]
MSVPMYEPLQAVPPINQQHVRMAWLLQARQAARKALDAVLAAPRRAAGYLSRLAHKLHLDAALSWLHRTTSYVMRPLTSAAQHLGRSGLVAAVTAVVTSHTGRAVVDSAARTLGTLLSWLARTTYSGVDRGLRCFGVAGNKVADKLFAGVVALGGKVATIATPVVHRVARLSDPATPQARLLSALCRSYVLHRLLKGLLGNTWMRLVVEAALIPAVVDSRLAVSIRTALQETRVRAQRLQEQAVVVEDLLEDDTVPASGMPTSMQVEQLILPEDIEEVVPTNRAERRVAQRQGKRSTK